MISVTEDLLPLEGTASQLTESEPGDATAGSPQPEPPAVSPSVGLVWWERLLSGALAAAAGGAGGVSVFTTQNEVGSAALLLFSAVFALIAVQGTAIRRANRESIELDPRARSAKVEQRARAVLVERGPESADEFVMGAITTDPDIERTPRMSELQRTIRQAMDYELRVADKIRQIRPDDLPFERARASDLHADLVLLTAAGAPRLGLITIFSEARRSSESDQIRRTMARISASRIPVLVVSNSQAMVEEVTARLAPIDDRIAASSRSVRWESPVDDDGLVTALAEALSPSPPAGRPPPGG